MALHTRVLRLVLSGLMGALLVVSKQAMSGLPNLEPVSLLIILFALELPRETPALSRYLSCCRACCTALACGG